MIKKIIKIGNAELCFLYIALLLNAPYHLVKFQHDPFNTFGVMPQTKENHRWAKGDNSKSNRNKIIVRITAFQQIVRCHIVMFKDNPLILLKYVLDKKKKKHVKGRKNMTKGDN